MLRIAFQQCAVGVPSIRITGCGTFLLAERTPTQVRYFDEGREAEFFSSTSELVAKASTYLGNRERLAKVAAAGQTRCLNSGYSWRSIMRRDLERILNS